MIFLIHVDNFQEHYLELRKNKEILEKLNFTKNAQAINH